MLRLMTCVTSDKPWGNTRSRSSRLKKNRERRRKKERGRWKSGQSYFSGGSTDRSDRILWVRKAYRVRKKLSCKSDFKSSRLMSAWEWERERSDIRFRDAVLIVISFCCRRRRRHRRCRHRCCCGRRHRRCRHRCCGCCPDQPIFGSNSSRWKKNQLQLVSTWLKISLKSNSSVKKSQKQSLEQELVVHDSS